MIARNIVFLSILMSFSINALADENYDPQSEPIMQKVSSFKIPGLFKKLKIF